MQKQVEIFFCYAHEDESSGSRGIWWCFYAGRMQQVKRVAKESKHPSRIGRRSEEPFARFRGNRPRECWGFRHFDESGKTLLVCWDPVEALSARVEVVSCEIVHRRGGFDMRE